MTFLTNTDISLLHNLFKSNGKLDSYTLLIKCKISFKEYAIAVNKLVRNELITENDNNILLTKSGNELIIKQKISNRIKKIWRNIPLKYNIQQHPVNEPYVPSISKLDKKTFK